MPPQCGLDLVELPAAQHGKAYNREQVMVQEAALLRGKIREDARIVALDERGKSLTSMQLSEELRQWQLDARPVDLLVGGADGLHPQLLAQADLRWSLSALTLPHMLVRVVLAETLYRAHCILKNHPYHRA